MIIDYLSGPSYTLTNPGGNYTNNGYPARIPTITPPYLAALTTGLQAIGDGVIGFGETQPGGAGGYAPTHLMLIPFGAGASTNTFSMKVLGWRPTAIKGQPAAFPLWIPVELGTYLVTLGTGTGVAGADLTTTALFATTITMTGGPTFVTSGAAPVSLDWLQISPGSNAIGMICVTSFGFRYLETIYTTGGVATSCNALYCKF